MAAEQCSHESLEFVGEDRGRNRYYRCNSCGSILVSDGKRTWSISGPGSNH
jgi:uncharacterized Zn finger protein